MSSGGEFIDMHAVCVREQMAPVRGRHLMCDVAQQLALYGRLGVAKGVIMPIANAECTPTGQANEEVLRIVKAHPDRFAAFCNLDPRNCYNSPNTNFVEVLEQYKAKGCRGVGAVCAKLVVTDLRVQNLFRSCEETSLPVAIRLDGTEDYGCGLYDPPGLGGLKDALARYPKLTFLATGPAFWCEISAPKLRDERMGAVRSRGPVKEGMVASLLREFPNLMCDLSGQWGEDAMLRDPTYAAKFLSEFADRVVFGLGAVSPEDAGASLPRLPGFLRGLRDSGAVSADVFGRVASGNARKIAGV